MGQVERQQGFGGGGQLPPPPSLSKPCRSGSAIELCLPSSHIAEHGTLQQNARGSRQQSTSLYDTAPRPTAEVPQRRRWRHSGMGTGNKLPVVRQLRIIRFQMPPSLRRGRMEDSSAMEPLPATEGGLLIS